MKTLMWNIYMLALKPETKSSQNVGRYKFNSRTKLSHIREELHLEEEKLLWARHRKLFVIIV